MAVQKDINYMSASDIAVILTYLLSITITGSNVYIALLQLGLVTKDMFTNEWIPTETGKNFSQARDYTDKKTGEKKIFYVWNKSVVDKLRKYFEEFKNGGNK